MTQFIDSSEELRVVAQTHFGPLKNQSSPKRSKVNHFDKVKQNQTKIKEKYIIRKDVSEREHPEDGVGGKEKNDGNNKKICGRPPAENYSLLSSVRSDCIILIHRLNRYLG
jgi:hypothetical protein